MVKREAKLSGKILFVHQGFELYGSDKVLLLNIKAAKEKYPTKTIVVVLPKKGELSDVLEKENNVEILIKKLGVIRKYDFKRFNFSAFIRIFSFFRLINFLNSFELVYINSIVIVDYILAARFIKRTTYIHIHELPLGFTAKIFSGLLSFSKASLIFVSKASKESFSNLKNKDQKILWNGIKAIKKTGGKKGDNKKIRLLLIGRINTWKGQPLLIKAISLLGERDKKGINVRIVGDVYLNQQLLKNKLIEQINDYNLQNTVKILPFTITPDVLYNWADVVIVPSLLPEPFGLVAIEAMSAGKLVIAANHGGLTEIIQDQVTGLFFEPGDASNLAEKISEIINNPHLIKEMGASGFDTFQDKFGEETYIKKFGEIVLIN